MEQQLEQLVREQGFEAVFTTLKTIVTREHERAKRDFDFLQTLVQPSVPVVQPSVPVVQPSVPIVQPPATEEDIKTIEIPTTMKLAKKIIRKTKAANE